LSASNSQSVTVGDLEAYADAWSRHDVDAIMSLMAEDCVFMSSAGPARDGSVFRGQREVREGIARIFEVMPTANWTKASHFVCGDRGVSEWTFTASMPSGSVTDVRGCDVFTFQKGKILVKDSFRKAINP
jgi:ketosteroid isomerase-like protein